MKRADLIKELSEKGVTFKEGTKHTKAYFGKRQTTVPRHREIAEGTVKAIKKQLGID